MKRLDLLAAVFGAVYDATPVQGRILAALYVRETPLHWERLRIQSGCASKGSLEGLASRLRKIAEPGILCRDQHYRLTDAGRERLGAALEEAKALL